MRGREVVDDKGGGAYCTSDLRPSKNGTHVEHFGWKKDTIHLEHVNAQEKQNKTKNWIEMPRLQEEWMTFPFSLENKN